MPPCPRLQAVQMLPWAAAPLVHRVSDPGTNGITSRPHAACENTGLYVSSLPRGFPGEDMYMCVQGGGEILISSVQFPPLPSVIGVVHQYLRAHSTRGASHKAGGENAPAFTRGNAPNDASK